MDKNTNDCGCNDDKTNGGCYCDESPVTDLSKKELEETKTTLEKRLGEINDALTKAK
ncbi:MAG: hypothetical protein NT149_01585 [Candidatus Gottesmanbacteria bacterium]|nr:hypothetical protein [Candidatus Gottesmanbacteria bacterium]